MSNVIKIKRGDGTPTTSNTQPYELAYDYATEKLYIHDANNSPASMVEITGSSGISHDGSTANGVLTYKDADEATVESTLTFDGSNNTLNLNGQYNDVTLNGTSNGTLGCWEFVNSGTWGQTRFYVQDANNVAGRLTFDFRGNAGSSKILAGDSQGKVGIGTITPATNLHISSGSAQTDNDGMLKVEQTSTSSGSSATNAGINTKNYHGTSQFLQWEEHGLRIGSRILTNSGTGDVAFTAGADSEKMRIKAGGNVGIGNVAPASWLDVSKDNSNSGNQFMVADTEGASAAVRTYTTSSPAGLILNHYYAVGGSPYMRYADFVANVGSGAATTMRFITKNSSNAYFTTTINDAGALTATSFHGDGSNLTGISGAVSAVSNGADNRIATFSSSTALYGESNLTYNGSTLQLSSSGNIEIGSGGANTAFIDLISDGTYTDYGARFIRWAGVNSTTDLVHRGTGDMRFITSEAANILWLTGGAEKMRLVHSNGRLGLGTNSPAYDLHVDGHAYASSSFLGPDGSAGTPTYRFHNDGNTGMFLLGGDQVALSSGGYYITLQGSNELNYYNNSGNAAALYINHHASNSEVNLANSGAEVGQTYGVRVPDGSVSTPTHSFRSDTNTGLYWAGSDQLGFTAGGANKMTMTTTALDLGSGDFSIKKTGGNNTNNYPAVEVYSAGTAENQAAIAIQQQTSEGDTIIFADFEPHVEWGISADNSADEIHFTGGSSTGSLGTKTFKNNAGSDRTAYKKMSVGLSNGNVSVGGTLTAGAYAGASTSGVLSTGSWAGDLTSNGYERVAGLSHDGGEFVLVEKSGQVAVLVDGDYFAYENNGFWSSNNSSYGNATGFKSNGAAMMMVCQKDGGAASLQSTGDLIVNSGYISGVGSADMQIRRTTNSDDRIVIEASETKIYGDASERIRFGSYGTRSDVVGSAGTPSYSFTNDTDTGMYRRGADQIGFSTGGSERAYITDAGIVSVGDFTTTGNSFFNYGMVVNEGGNNADFRVESVNDAHMFRVDADANKVGIRISNPQKTLHVFQGEGGVGAKHATIRLGGYSTVGPDIAAYRHTGNSNDQGLIFSTYHNSNGTTDTLTMDSEGRVGIGTTAPGSLLTVYKDGTQVSSPSTSYQIMTVSDSNGGIAIQAGASSDAFISFGDYGQYDAGRIRYHNSTHYMDFCTQGNNPRMTLKNDGKVVINGTDSDGMFRVNSTSSENAVKIYANAARGASRHALHIDDNDTNGRGSVVIDSASGTGMKITTQNSNWNMELVSADGGGSPAMSMGVRMQSFEGRANGHYQFDEDYSGQWFSGNRYAGNMQSWQVGWRDGSSGNTPDYIDRARIYVDTSGNLHADADVIAYSSTIGSDIKLKKNVKDINYGLKDVLDIRAVEFDWKEKRDGKHDIGFIAQEIEKIIPEVVNEVTTIGEGAEDGDTHKVVDYAKLTSVLMKAIQEQQVQIDELKTQIGE